MELLLFVKAHEFHRWGAETLVDLGLCVEMAKRVRGGQLTAFWAARAFPIGDSKRALEGLPQRPAGPNNSQSS